jgi:hypothetical protein
MNDPHVNVLRYELIPGKDIDYEKAPLLTEENHDFTFTITPKTAIFRMKMHVATEKEARAITGKYLEAYRIFVGLKLSPDEIMFNYTGAEIIDRNPHNEKRDANVPMHYVMEEAIDMKCEVNFHICRGNFIPSPKNFAVSPDVKTMFSRWKGYCQGEEKLLSMANFCLTVLETSAVRQSKKEKKRTAASRQYHIEFKVLDNLGQWSAKKGTEAEARKAPENNQRGFVPLTNNEEVWIKEVIKRMIMRVGEYAFDPNQQFQEITLAYFPPLNP